MFDPDAFSTDFAHPLIQPAPIEEQPPAESQDGGDGDTGPWITHGTVHTGYKPHH